MLGEGIVRIVGSPKKWEQQGGFARLAVWLSIGGKAVATLLGPAACIARANYFEKWSTTCASPTTRDRCIRIAKSWFELAGDGSPRRRRNKAIREVGADPKLADYPLTVGARHRA